MSVALDMYRLLFDVALDCDGYQNRASLQRNDQVMISDMHVEMLHLIRFFIVMDLSNVATGASNLD